MLISGQKYIFGKLNARKQFHVARRLAPAIADIAPLLKLIKSEEVEDKEEFGIKAIEMLGNALSKLKDDDADFILDSLLDSVSRELGQGTGSAPIRSNGVMMYQDIDMPTELALAFHAIKANFADFMPTIRSALNQQSQKPNAQ
jgi:hypothetical protein